VVNQKDAKVFGVSGEFHLYASLTLENPAGGEKWYYGDTKSIKWTPHGDLDYVVIKYKIGSGTWHYLPGAEASDNLDAGESGAQQSKDWKSATPWDLRSR